MIVAVMQPYLFPYIGYFQLMRSVDSFVSYDDVQYINRGWINRNRVLVNSEPAWITLSVRKASTHLPINAREYVDLPVHVDEFLRKLRGAYALAPQFATTMELVRACLTCSDENVASFNQHTLRVLAQALGVECNFLVASQLDIDKNLRAQNRVLAICEYLGATRYVNPIGGLQLYDENAFANCRMSLRFLNPAINPYPQFGDAFVSSLSIIDVLMFNPIDRVREMLSDCTLVTSKWKTAAHATP